MNGGGGWEWAWGWGLVGGAAVLAFALQGLVYLALGVAARRRPGVLLLDGTLLDRVRGPIQVLAPLLAMRVACEAADRFLAAEVVRALSRTLEFGLIVALTWLAIRVTVTMDDVTTRRFSLEPEDNLRARRIRTRVGLLRRVLVVAIAVVGLGVLLLQTPGFRTVGTGLLASAGVLGVIFGVAAQRPIANLLAGLQIAVTQPIRVEDAVIVEGEWGWVEEITLTYVVVRLWDLRRLVLPIGYFLEKPFQNWTRTSASLRCVVFLYADYTVPVDELRRELDRIVHESPLWDGTLSLLQVTELTDSAVQLRALAGARNAGHAWDLQCEIREKLMAYLQRHHPEALPRVRLAGPAGVLQRG